MSQMINTFEDFKALLDDAEAFYTVDFKALNNSGVQASALFAVDMDGGMNGDSDDGSDAAMPTLNILLTATDTTPNQSHIQHIHGLFDDNGTPIDSVAPTIADDADRDGLVEVLEGVGKYGDVLLSLAKNGAMPVADGDGDYTYINSFDLTDDTLFSSPVTGNDYTAEDLMPLELREVVIHGVDVPDGIGEGTTGEVDGGENGFTPILPAAAGEIEEATREQADAILDAQLATASKETTLTDGDDTFGAGAGADRVFALAGNDTVTGGSEDDFIDGGAGIDVLDGNEGNDTIVAGNRDENAMNASDNGASGALSLADYDGGIAGGDGNDLIMGGAGDEILTGDDDSRISNETGAVFNIMADGMDTIFGGAGNDEIHTGTWTDSDQDLPNAQFGDADDVAHGGAGDDILRGANGNDKLYGDSGADNIGGGGGDDMIFGDGVYSKNVEEFTGQLFRLYQASFDRDPDIAGFEGWAAQLGTERVDLPGIASGFVGSQEFRDTFGSNDAQATNEAFVDGLYNNVLDREADAEGRASWLESLESGSSRADVLIGFSQSMEFKRSSADELVEFVEGIGTHDVIAGNGGDNVLSGGYFSDTFVFGNDAASSHTVTDLESWDMLDFTAFGFDSADDVISKLSQVEEDVVFAENDTTVTLQNTDLATLADDMIIV